MIVVLVMLMSCVHAFAGENDDIKNVKWIEIDTSDGVFVVDTLNGIPAYYDGTGSGTYYQCMEYVVRYYRELYEVYGVPCYAEYPPSDTVGSFKITSSPKVGDIVYWPAVRRGKSYQHYAIVKEVRDGALVIIEQNWQWNNQAALNRVITFPSTGDYYDIWTYDGATQTSQGEGSISQPEPQPISTPTPQFETIYDVVNGNNLIMPHIDIAKVRDAGGANDVLKTFLGSLTKEQKSSAVGAAQTMLLSEELASGASSIKTDSADIAIYKKQIQDAQKQTAGTLSELRKTMISSGISIKRNLSTIVTFESTASDKKVSIYLDESYLQAEADKLKVKLPFASLCFKKDQVKSATIALENLGTQKVGVDLSAQDGSIITLSIPVINNNNPYMAIVDESGKPVGGKYNPATNALEAKISHGGIYEVKSNVKTFDDINSEHPQVQEAVKFLAAKGIINGANDTVFGADAPVMRAEVAAIVLRMLCRLDAGKDGGFEDVPKDCWYYGVAGSSKKHGIMNGFGDNTFRGGDIIAKDQVMVLAARVLKTEAGYAIPADVGAVLDAYADSAGIADWAKSDIAIAESAGLILKRSDKKFDAAQQLTRSDVAVTMYRLYNLIW